MIRQIPSVKIFKCPLCKMAHIHSEIKNDGLGLYCECCKCQCITTINLSNEISNHNFEAIVKTIYLKKPINTIRLSKKVYKKVLTD